MFNARNMASAVTCVPLSGISKFTFLDASSSLEEILIGVVIGVIADLPIVAHEISGGSIQIRTLPKDLFADLRRLGARLLHRLPKPAPGLRQCMVG
jgi:hypothetical protein